MYLQQLAAMIIFLSGLIYRMMQDNLMKYFTRKFKCRGLPEIVVWVKTIDIRLSTLQPFTDAKNKGSGKRGSARFDRTRHALTTGSQS